jgi:formate dehydrogenase major subunit
VPGLGTTFGRGGATTFASDLQHSDAILIMGSNMAECHPVAFRWVVQAKTREANPCQVIHVDPRFTRTSALANIYAPLRAGSDIVFLGALIRFVLEQHQPIFQKPAETRTPRDRFFHDYLVHYTNAATLITEDFRDTEENELAGVFSGFDAEGRRYDSTKWRYAQPVQRDPTLQQERSVWQILRRHFARYTPELVAEVCGTPKEVFLQVAETLINNSGPERTSSLCYAVGWTQHTTGVQIIRAAAILQLLLGNIGRPGGGILALRGHATIQGSTDIATLYNLLPGYLNAPSALREHETLADYLKTETQPTSYWSNTPKFFISLLKAWFGAAATKENDFGYDWLPKTIGDHSHMPMFVAMSEGRIQGFFAMGQNPAVGGQNASYQRQALAKLKWLIVRDLYETETASFWKDAPEVKSGQLRPEEIETEVFLLPAAAVPESAGTFTNTQRLVQWHDHAVDPPGDARSDIWFTYHLGLKLKELYRDSKLERDRPIQALVWNYDHPRPESRIADEPDAELILKEINGYVIGAGSGGLRPPLSALRAGGVSPLSEATPIPSFTALKDDGSTACGAWIYSGVYAPTPAHPLGHNHAANRQGDGWVSPNWGFAWPANRRILYNRASADLEGKPWAKERRLSPGGYVWWDETAQRWRGIDVPDFPIAKSPSAPGSARGSGLDTQDGASPFIMKADGKGWLYVPVGLADGPLPTHYEPYESPVRNQVYRQQSNPTALVWNVPGNAYAPVGAPEYPCVLSTYRLTEHHLSGTMSRWLPWLAELMPELFCEISPEHAAELGVRNTSWVEITTPRGSIRAKALVTRRIRPFRLKDQLVHHVGLPWHWGYKGLATGDVVNDLTALVGDPNVSIHEAKVFVCRVSGI